MALALGLSVGICEGGLPGAYTYDNLELSSTRITALIALADKVSKSFGGRTLYSQATLQLNAGERWALVGPNGSGKTTFLKIFMGLEPADEGTVTFAKETTVGYLEQETKLAGKKTALAEVVDSAQEVKRYERLVSELEQKISSAEPGPELDRLLECGLTDLPPGDVLEDVTPWKRAMNRVATSSRAAPARSSRDSAFP